MPDTETETPDAPEEVLWTLYDFDPEHDEEAPEGDPETDCNGSREDDDEQPRTQIMEASGTFGGPCRVPVKTVVLSNGVKLPVHVELAELIARLCEETMRRGYRLVPGWCWGYACRKIRGTNTWSNHSQATAVDLNAPTNPHKRPLTTNMPSWMPQLWESYGFRWGGRYTGKPDAMHYEFMGTVQDARRQTERARRELGGAQPAPPPPPPPGPTPNARPWPGTPSRRYGGYNRPEYHNRKDGNVQWIQAQINRTNRTPKLREDGFYGPTTEDAVRGFQGAVRLPVDGIVGPQTWQRLGQF